MSTASTHSSKHGRINSTSSTASQSQPNSDTAAHETRLDGQSNSTSDEHVLRKLDELFGDIEDAEEKLRLISKAIGRLQQMKAQLSQYE